MVANIETYNLYKQDAIRLYTLEEAEKIISDKICYFMKQKLCGFLVIIIGIVCPILLEGDVTFSLFAIPLGIELMVTKQRVMSFRM